MSADEVDALYELPPDEFVAARNELATRTKNADLRKLKRPSQAAAIVNLLARRRRADVERLVAAGRTLRDAQARGDGVEAAMGTERDALTKLVDAARDEGAASDTVLARVRATLQAAAADDDAAAQVLAARLEKELEPPGFAPLLAAAAAAGPRPKAKQSGRGQRAARPKRDLEAERRRREAEQELRAAERELERAQRRVQSARAALDRLG